MSKKESKDNNSECWQSGITYTQQRYSKRFFKIILGVIVVIFASLVGAIIGSTLTFNRYKEEIVQCKQQVINDNENKTFSSETIKKVAQDVGPSIVGISKDSSNWIEEAEKGSLGSGIIIDENGHIITNQHVVSGLSNITVTLAGGRRVTATVVAEDFKSDIAVLKINEQNLTAVKFSKGSVKTGDVVIGIGNPYGEEFCGNISVGVISATNKVIKVDDRAYTIYQTDISFSKDNSGGAIVNESGAVIGIINNKLNQSQEGSYIMPIGEAKIVTEALLKDGKMYTPFLGVKTTLIDEERAKRYSVPKGLGVLEVVKGTTAEKYGIQKGDIILNVEGKRISKITDITDSLEGKKPGDKVDIKIYRKGREITFNAILIKKQS